MKRVQWMKEQLNKVVEEYCKESEHLTEEDMPKTTEELYEDFALYIWYTKTTGVCSR